MLLSTLPDLPGRPYDVRGLVYASVNLAGLGGGSVHTMVQSIVEQAARFGADAVVDIKTIIGGQYSHCVMTGTAVKLLDPADRPQSLA